MDDHQSIINEAPVKGLSIFTAAIFIIGEMSGTGVLSLPNSLNQSGWTGVAMILVCCFLSGYCGFRLSSCWTMLLEKKEELREGVRDPFPLIAYEAAGKIGRRIVEVSCYIQLFGVAVIFLLIAAANIRSLLSHFVLQFCDWTILIALVMCPVSMLGTPKDFWPMAVGAMLFTAVACLFIFIQTMRQSLDGVSQPSKVSFKSFFISFGTILFCFGGAAMFPTIQSDMKQPSQFKTSLLISYIVLLIFYLPVSIGGYCVFGAHTKNNIIENMNDNWLKTLVTILITGHLLTAFTIILNPLFQGFEEIFKVPKKFGLKRVLLRTIVILSVLFVAQSVPNFGPILSFIGGSTVSLLSFILPCIFYILLTRKDAYRRRVSLLEWILLITCVVISILGGIASTYASIDELINPKTFTRPCYLNRTQ